MQTIKKILVDIDPDKQQQPALDKALHFAKQQPITIKLLSCLYYPSVVASNLLTPKQLEKTQAEILKKQQGKLDALMTQHSQSNVTFETEVMWHSPIYQGILKVVGNFKPDLVIKATHQHKVIARRMFTPTDWYLLKACPVPILLVKSHEWTQNTSIVAAIDPEHNLSKESKLDKNILKTGFTISSTLGMPLHALHCFDPSYWDILLEAVDKSGMWADVFSFDQHQNESMALEQLRYQHNVKFAEECSEYVPKSENQHIISGDIDHVLPKTLKLLEAGILVLGTTYRTGLLGSTAQRLIETVECDVLAVKPKGFEAPFH
ncbi:MAG: universal stress protein E [Gammaproteobacteria bacterium]|jgi:universal stress protein E